MNRAPATIALGPWIALWVEPRGQAGARWGATGAWARGHGPRSGKRSWTSARYTAPGLAPGHGSRTSPRDTEGTTPSAMRPRPTRGRAEGGRASGRPERE